MTRWTLLIFLAACGGASASAPPPAAPAAPADTSGAAAVCACADKACADQAFTPLFEAQMRADAPDPARDADYDRAVACFRERWPSGNGELLMRSVPGLVDELCACTDATCFDSAYSRLTDWVRVIGGGAVIDRAEIATLSRSIDRFTECAARLAPQSPIVAIFKTAADEMCSCPDSACAQAAAERGNASFEEYKKTHEGTKVSRADADAVKALVEKGAECLRKISEEKK